MTQDKDPWDEPEEGETSEPKEYEGDFPPGSEPEPKERPDQPDCGTGGSGPPDASDPPAPDRIGGGPEDCRE
jgi:hypothetical protein